MTQQNLIESTVAFVFARGGSKGLPGKNIRIISGHPLIAHSIKMAQSIPCINQIFVSTDCPEIASIAEHYGASVIQRPHELASDTSPEWLSWQHAIKFVLDRHGAFGRFLSLPATAPMRSREDVVGCLNALTSDVDMVVTMSPAHRSPWFNLVCKNQDGRLSLASHTISPNAPVVHRRQDAPQCFDLTTVAYVSRPEFIINNENLWSGTCVGVEIPSIRAIDIDTPVDFAIARFLMEDWIQTVEDQ